MVNNVVLVGRITRDLELRTSPQGVTSLRFSVAVNRRFKNAAGEYEADFINCVAFRQTAEYLANYGKKGALVSVTGNIRTGSYENQQGQRVYTTDVFVDNVSLLESRAVRENQGGGSSFTPQQQNNPAASTSAPVGDQYSPDFGRAADPFSGNKLEINDDDLPF